MEGNQLFTWSLPSNSTVRTQNKHTQTSVPPVGFELPNSAHALDRATTVIGSQSNTSNRIAIPLWLICTYVVLCGSMRSVSDNQNVRTAHAWGQVLHIFCIMWWTGQDCMSLALGNHSMGRVAGRETAAQWGLGREPCFVTSLFIFVSMWTMYIN
jgi:hypothetical protein